MDVLTRRGFVVLCASAAASVVSGCAPTAGSVSAGESRNTPSNDAVEYASSNAAGELRLMTGGQRGMYHEFGGQIASHAQSANLDLNVLISDGSRANVESVALEQVEFALCQADVLSYAHDGERAFDGSRLSSFSIVAALYDEPVQVITCDPSIKGIDDLRDKYVSVGLQYSGTCFNAWDVLGAYGITRDDITPYYLSFGDAASALAGGVIDAAFVTAGMPTPAIAYLADAKPIRFVKIDEEHIDQLVGSSPHYMHATVPANTYPDQSGQADTLAVTGVLIASNAVPEESVYALVSDIFQTAEDPQASALHQKYAEVTLEKATSVQGISYHRGAARFFSEKGITVQAD